MADVFLSSAVQSEVIGMEPQGEGIIGGESQQGQDLLPGADRESQLRVPFLSPSRYFRKTGSSGGNLA